MDDALLLFEKILRKNDLHITKARKALFEALWNSEPQTMHSLEEQLVPGIDRTSIYRSVELFTKLNIIHKLQIGWKYKVELSDVFVAHHHHISCLGCGKVVTVHENEAIEKIISDIAHANHFTRPVHQLEIQGYCRECSR